MSFQHIDFKNYRIIRTLKNVDSLQFYLVEDVKTKKQKTVININNSPLINYSKQMLDYIFKFDHPLFTIFYGYSLYNFQGDHSIMLFFHDFQYGTLDKILEDERNSIFLPNFTSTKKYIILLSISLGIKYSHSYGNLNCFLSTNNIFLDENYYPRMFKFYLIPEMKFNEIDPIYIAPEIKKGENQSYSSDVYSFSMIAYELFTGQKPFINKENLHPDLSKIENEDIKKFLSKCWSENPQERPSFGQIFESLKQKEIKTFFDVNEEEVLKFLNLYENELKDLNHFKPFDINEPINDKNADEIFIRGLILHQNKKDENEAAKMFKLAADRGNSMSMLYYSIMLEEGKGIDNCKEKSLHYLKMAVDKGNLDAMFKYAVKYYTGDGVKIDKQKAIHYFKLAADKGHVLSMINVGKYYIENDLNQSIYYLKKASEYGNIDAMFYYGYLLCNRLNNVENGLNYLKIAADNGSISAIGLYAAELLNKKENEEEKENKNKKEAAKYLRKGIKYGDTNSMLNYGKMLFNGDGIEMNRKKGIEFIKKAADLGDVNAMESFVKSFVNLVDKNKEEAYLLFNTDDVIHYQEMATKTDDPDTYLRYAELFRFGWCKIVDKKKTAYYMKLAADKGCIQAMFEYGLMCRDGDCEKTNKKMAAHYLKLAADKGHALSMQNYSIMLFEGDGIEKNDKESFRYLKMAAQAGNVNAKLMLQIYNNKQ